MGLSGTGTNTMSFGSPAESTDGDASAVLLGSDVRLLIEAKKTLEGVLVQHRFPLYNDDKHMNGGVIHYQLKHTRKMNKHVLVAEMHTHRESTLLASAFAPPVAFGGWLGSPRGFGHAHEASPGFSC